MAVAFEPADPDALLGLADVAAVAGITRGHGPGVVLLSGRLPSIMGRGTSRSSGGRDLDTWLARRAAPRQAAAGRPRSRRRRRRAAPPGRGGQRPARSRDDLCRRRRRRDGGLPARPDRALAVRRASPQPAQPRCAARPSDEVLGWVSGAAERCPTAGMRAIEERDVVVLRDTLVEADRRGPRPLRAERDPERLLRADRSSATSPVGLFVLYHDSRSTIGPPRRRRWPAGSPTRWRPRSATRRLNESVRSLAARLEAVQDLAIRLNRTRDIDAIARADRRGHGAADRPRLDPRLSRRPRDRDVRAHRLPRLVRRLLGARIRRSLRVAIGEGLTGWAAAHNETVLVGDAAADPRALRRFLTRRAGVDPRRADQLRGPRPRRDRRVGDRPRPVRARRRDDADDLRAAMPPRRSSTPTSSTSSTASGASSSTSSPASAASSRSTSG